MSSKVKKRPPRRLRTVRTTKKQEVQALLRDALRVLAPPPDLTVSEWADRFLFLPTGTTREAGRFRSDTFPWIPGMLDDLTHPDISEHVWCFASRLAKTTCALAATGYFVHHFPSNILWKYP